MSINPEETLSRFTTLEDLFHMFEWGGIPLYDASRWDDLVDKSFLEKAIEKRYGALAPYGVLCFLDSVPTDRDDNKSNAANVTSAHWAIYGGYGRLGDRSDVLRFGVRIDFNKAWLEKQAALMREKANVVCGEVKYVSSLLNSRASFKHMVLSKRYAYEWEKEWRLLAIGQEQLPDEVLLNGAQAFIKVDNWKKAIQRIVFSPYIKPCNLPDRVPSIGCVRLFVCLCLDSYCTNKRKESDESNEDSWLTKIEDFIMSRKCHRSEVLDSKLLLKKAEKGCKVMCPFDSGDEPLCCWHL